VASLLGLDKLFLQDLLHGRLYSDSPEEKFLDLSIDSPCECEHNNPVLSVAVCYTAVDAAAGGLTTGWWAVLLECFSSHPLWYLRDAVRVNPTFFASLDKLFRRVLLPERLHSGYPKEEFLDLTPLW